MSKWEKIKTERVFDHKYFKVNKDIVKLPDGRTIDWFYWFSEDSAMVAALTADNKLVMIRQYRYLPDETALEFPSGKGNDDESMESCAKREFEEETGFECGKLTKLGEFYETMAQLNRKIHIYFAADAKPAENRKRSLDENEDIEVVLVDVADAVSSVREGKISSMGSSLAIMLLKDYLNKNA
jgi:ADP-ribose pyrophosphatase